MCIFYMELSFTLLYILSNLLSCTQIICYQHRLLPRPVCFLAHVLTNLLSFLDFLSVCLTDLNAVSYWIKYVNVNGTSSVFKKKCVI